MKIPEPEDRGEGQAGQTTRGVDQVLGHTAEAAFDIRADELHAVRARDAISA